MRRRFALLVVSLLFGTACGSTAHQPGLTRGASSPGSGLSVAPGTSSSGTTSSGGLGGAGGSVSSGAGTTGGSVSSGGGASSGTTGGSTGGTGAGTARPSASAPGVTATTISIGALYIKNQEQANCAIGACGAGGGDARDAYNVVIGEINKHGGLFGRKVVPVYAPIDATSSTPSDQQYQAACAKWTQDNKVFAILAGAEPIVEECAKKAGAVELYANPAGGGSVPETFRRYPDYVEIIGINLVRMGSVTVDGLAKQGYFGDGPKIGMVTWDEPEYKEGLEKGYLPALRKHGLGLATAPVYLTPPQTLQDLGATSAQVNDAVLKFSSLGIDHVMLLGGRAGLCGVGCMELQFLQRAKAQHYYPRYGFNDNNAPVAALKAGAYPPDQLSGSLSVGWLDMDKSYDAGWHVNAVRERCYALMRKHGVFMGSVNAQANALEACDEFAFMLHVVDKMGGAALSASNFMAGVNAIGGGFTPTSVYGTRISATQHDGAAAVRNMRFVDSCKCYRYTSDPYRV